MKYLLDHNVPRPVVNHLQTICPGSAHASRVGLERADDIVIWEYARDHDFVVLTQDRDDLNLSVRYGAPPKVVWLRVGSIKPLPLYAMLVENHGRVEAFVADPNTGLMILP